MLTAKESHDLATDHLKTMASALRAVGLLVSLAILLGLSEAVMFDIPGSGRKCLGEEVTEKQEVSIRYGERFGGHTGFSLYSTCRSSLWLVISRRQTALRAICRVSPTLETPKMGASSH